MSIEKLKETVGEGYCYLASPYSKYEEGIEVANQLACEASGQLLVQGIPVFCPIAQSHSISVNAGLPTEDHDLWLNSDRPLLAKANALVILAIKGWNESFGVTWEIEHYQKIITNQDKTFFMLPSGRIVPYEQYML